MRTSIVFLKCTEHSTAHKSPIVWYVKHGHFYLITDKSSIYSIAHSQRATNKRTIAEITNQETRALRLVDLTCEALADAITARSIDGGAEAIYVLPTHDLDEAYFAWVRTHWNEGEKINLNANDNIREFTVAFGKRKLTFKPRLQTAALTIPRSRRPARTQVYSTLASPCKKS